MENDYNADVNVQKTKGLNKRSYENLPESVWQRENKVNVFEEESEEGFNTHLIEPEKLIFEERFNIDNIRHELDTIMISLDGKKDIEAISSYEQEVREEKAAEYKKEEKEMDEDAEWDIEDKVDEYASRLAKINAYATFEQRLREEYMDATGEEIDTKTEAYISNLLSAYNPELRVQTEDELLEEELQAELKKGIVNHEELAKEKIYAEDEEELKAKLKEEIKAEKERKNNNILS